MQKKTFSSHSLSFICWRLSINPSRLPPLVCMDVLKLVDMSVRILGYRGSLFFSVRELNRDRWRSVGKRSGWDWSSFSRADGFMIRASDFVLLLRREQFVVDHADLHSKERNLSFFVVRQKWNFDLCFQIFQSLKTCLDANGVSLIGTDTYCSICSFSRRSIRSEGEDEGSHSETEREEVRSLFLDRIVSPKWMNTMISPRSETHGGVADV